MRSLLLLCLSLWLSLEAAGFAAGYFAQRLYDPSTLPREEERVDLLHRLTGFRRGVPALGWAPQVNSIDTHDDCDGQSHDYDHDIYGARIYPGYNPEEAEILLLGDSYTYGDELDSFYTIAAQLYRITGKTAVNLGTPGYGPVQAFMRGRKLAGYFPNARYVVLGIMNENINRMLASYTETYWRAYWNAPGYYSLKPYMKDGLIMPFPDYALRSRHSYELAVSEAIRTDYWARPPYEFPYSLAFFRALTSHAFNDMRKMAEMRLQNREFYHQYMNPAISNNLLALLNAYAAWAMESKLTPIVVFLPMNYRDTTSPMYWIRANQQALAPNLIVRNLNARGVDFVRYNKRPSGDCHPSAYGAGVIARQYQRIIDQSQIMP